MTTAKTIVCRCEDVTEAELQAAIGKGFHDLEGLKRYVGFGMGPCQGKGCVSAVLALLARMTEPQQVRRMRTRPPAQPVPLGLLAGEEEE